MIRTKETISETTAIQSATSPSNAAIMIIIFIAIAINMFYNITNLHILASFTISGRRSKLSFRITTSAVVDAIAVPPAPMATPMFEAANAGASLIPSPTIITLCVFYFSKTQSSLPFGSIEELISMVLPLSFVFLRIFLTTVSAEV